MPGFVLSDSRTCSRSTAHLTMSKDPPSMPRTPFLVAGSARPRLMRHHGIGLVSMLSRGPEHVQG